jgi:hypothetical protein
MTTRNINHNAQNVEQFIGISTERAKQLRSLIQETWKKNSNLPFGRVCEETLKQCNGENEEMYVYGLLCAATAYRQAYEQTESETPSEFNPILDVDLTREFTWTTQGERNVANESTGQSRR